jgi:hypothetical protein
MDSETAGDEILPRFWKYMTADETLVSTQREHEQQNKKGKARRTYLGKLHPS